MEQGAGVVIELVKPTMEIVGKGIAKSLKRQCNYLCCFSKNIKSLEEEAKKLEDETVELQGKVDIAKRNAQVILPKVNRWFTKTEELQDEREKIEGEIVKAQSSCLNIVSRYSLSKRAKVTADGMKNQIDNSKIDPVAQPPPTAAETPFPLEETILLQSRKDIEDEIVEKLASPAGGSRKVGIGGMGGVGKTTIAKRIMHRMMVEKSVDEAIMVIVAQQPDVSKIQLQMAEQLGFTELKNFETPQERARRLSHRLANKRILIVLDDVWKRLKLEEVGIYYKGPSGGLSILLTSRDAEVLKDMKAHEVININILSETEAWSLFKDKAGACVHDSNITSTAQEIVRECKGLPLALVTVGSVLKDEVDIRIWEEVLRRLRSPNPKKGTRVRDEVYNPLRLSYDFLQDEDAKSLFLLCSLFPDDFEISLNDLALYSMGLRMFEGVHSLKQVRARTFIVVMELKKRFLLMDCDDENKVKMHDVVRDVAIIIAKEKGLLGAELESEGQLDENCKWISVFSNSSNELFDNGRDFKFRSLQLLDIHCTRRARIEDLEIGDISVLERMQELNVLSLTSSSFNSFGKSVTLPNSLRTLQLTYCKDTKVLSFVDAFLNLEILSCYYCWGIEELPKEMGRLKFLKLLDLSLCIGISRIAPGVIASLIKLEELKMLNSFRGWESIKVKKEDRKNAALKELQSLEKLRCLEIEIEDTELAKEEISLSSQIEEYAIFIGQRKGWGRVKSKKVFSLRGIRGNTVFAKWIHRLVSTTDGELYLDGDGSTSFDLSPVYNKIKTLEIGSCDISSVMLLVRTPNPEISFDSLCRIRIEECHKLRNLSWLRRTNDGILLPQLEEVEIIDCEMMEEVVFLNEKNNGDTSGPIVIFSKLVKLSLERMPRLTTIVRGAETIEFPSLEELVVGDCPMLLKSMEDGGHNFDDGCLPLFCTEKVHFSRLKHLSLNGLVVKNIWCPRISSSFFQTLERLEIKGCRGLRSLFEPSIVKNLVNLNELCIESCDEMEQLVVAAAENEREEICGVMEECKDDCGEMTIDGNGIIIFPNLKELELRQLDRLTSLGKGIASLEFPMLIQLKADECPMWRDIIYSAEGSKCEDCIDSHNHDDGDAFHLFFHQKVKFDGLRDLLIGNIDIRSNLLCQQIPQHFFRELMELRIDHCNNIENLFSISMVEKLVNLERLSVMGCRQMKQAIIIVDEVRNEIQKENDDGDNDCVGAAGNKHHITLFPKLRKLYLWNLPKLTCFGKGMESIEFPMLEDLQIEDCPELIGMVASTGEGGKNNSIQNDEERVGEQTQKQMGCDDENCNVLFNHKVKFDALQRIHLAFCTNLKSICSCTMVENLVNLKDLTIKMCEQMETVITADGKLHESSMRFPRIKSIEFYRLPSLKMFSSWSGALEFPSLEKMSIKKCPKWEHLIPGSISTSRLTMMEINGESIESSTEVGESSKTKILEIEKWR